MNRGQRSPYHSGPASVMVMVCAVEVSAVVVPLMVTLPPAERPPFRRSYGAVDVPHTGPDPPITMDSTAVESVYGTPAATMVPPADVAPLLMTMESFASSVMVKVPLAGFPLLESTTLGAKAEKPDEFPSWAATIW